MSSLFIHNNKALLFWPQHICFESLLYLVCFAALLLICRFLLLPFFNVQSCARGMSILLLIHRLLPVVEKKYGLFNTLVKILYRWEENGLNRWREFKVFCKTQKIRQVKISTAGQVSGNIVSQHSVLQPFYCSHFKTKNNINK